jgi:hypothetical protein
MISLYPTAGLPAALLWAGASMAQPVHLLPGGGAPAPAPGVPSAAAGAVALVPPPPLPIAPLPIAPLPIAPLPEAAKVEAAKVTTDGREYCAALGERVGDMARQARADVSREADRLAREGQRLCGDGQTRSGILHIRRAYILMRQSATPHGGEQQSAGKQ